MIIHIEHDKIIAFADAECAILPIDAEVPDTG